MKIIHMIVLTSFLVACGGRTPEPITAIQLGDRGMPCEDLEFELAVIEGEMAKRVGNRNKTGKNVALAVVGVAVFFPALFFMDFKHAAKHEYAAYKQRHEHLGKIANRKNCDAEINSYPTIQELEAEIEAAKERKK